jgi:hypothetical protein
MEHLMGDAGLRVELRERGFARVGDFSWDRVADETMTVYLEVLDGQVMNPGRKTAPNRLLIGKTPV